LLKKERADMNKMTVRDTELNGRRVLVRVDFNVPLAGDTITDDTRIRAALPTLDYILSCNPRAIILMSHLGRPKGERMPEMSLAPVVPALSKLLGRTVVFATDCIGNQVDEVINALPAGGLVLLENTRFHAGETENDPLFAAKLAQHGDVFVNDAFGTAHRAHASNVGVSAHLTTVAGLLLGKELNYLADVLEEPERPFVAILGGAKVSDKIEVIDALIDKVDKLLVGGGMSNTFFAAQGRDMADSLVEKDALDLAHRVLETAGAKLVLPVDQRIANAFSNDATQKLIASSTDVPAGWQSLDIGPATIEQFTRALHGAKTVVWNGPMGVFELPAFALGTIGVARALADETAKGATTIIGGGDSAAAVEQAGLAAQMSHISTGGGASLELLEDKELPGIAALRER
jgi:phosphoglycerate kinase